jgi:hypothetical protein
MRVFAKAYDAAIANPDFRRQFMLADWEETLVHDDPAFVTPVPRRASIRSSSTTMRE